MENWKEMLISKIEDELANAEPDKWEWPEGYYGPCPLFYIGTVLHVVREVLYKDNEED